MCIRDRTLTAAGNAFARWANKPGAIIRVPGIIMLVPGSASLRGLMSLVQQQDVAVGNSALLTVTNIVMALVAGLLFGNLPVSYTHLDVYKRQLQTSALPVFLCSQRSG